MTENQLFQRLQAQLSTLIEQTPAGQRLPSEPDLAKELGVSRATLREAMRAFEAQGQIRRRQGVGTFVVGAPGVMETGLELLESIETLAKRIQLPVSLGAIDINPLLADAAQAEKLRVAEGTPLVEVSRTILTADRPVAFLIDLLPQEYLLPEDLQQGFSGSVLDVLLHRSAPPLARSVAQIQAVSAKPQIAKKLQIQRGDVLLLLEAQLYGADGRIVDYSHSYFIPGHFRFHVVRRVGTA
ncbi:MAG TPA: GntR family transcriptional regulator [Anaerolineaceae bacterium]|nr:GntR family transcriptional regulator [Anaerolineaceae bacterium]HQH85830.1 GntR family transcriptional regulator [Anaerolineaceae bacterium]